MKDTQRYILGKLLILAIFVFFSAFIDPPKMPHEYISPGVNHRSLSFDSCR